MPDAGTVDGGSERPEPHAAKQRPRILLAEDDRELRALLASVLVADGCDLTLARSGSEMLQDIFGAAIRHFPEDPFHLIVTDQMMPNCTGLEALARVRTIGYAMPALLITAFPDDGIRVRAQSLQAVVLPKPFALAELRALVERSVRATEPELELTPEP